MAGKTAQKGDKDKIGTLTDQMRRFVAEYPLDFNGRNAAVRAGYSPRCAAAQASKLLARDDVADLIRAGMTRREQKLDITAERVLAETWGIATADVNDLVEFRIACCRHCYGTNFGHQRTAIEMRNDRAQFEVDKRKAIAKDPDLAADYEDFDEMGGIGYDARKPPNADCERCWGKGVGEAHFKDTRDLSPAAKALYAGVKQTKDGYQMLLIDKMGALEKLFKHLNLYKAEIKEQADALGEFLAAVQSKGGKLPIGKPVTDAPAPKRKWSAGT